MTTRKIVIPLEVTPISSEVLPTVQHLFEPDKTQLTLLGVVEPLLPPVIVADMPMVHVPRSMYEDPVAIQEWELHRQTVKNKVEQTAIALRKRGYSVSSVVVTGDPIQKIAEFVEQGDYDLLAMATYGRKGLDRLLSGSIAEQLLRLVTVPMLLYRHQATPPEASMLREIPTNVPQAQHKLTIAAAFDGSPHTQQAVLLANNLRQALQADLKVLVTARGRDGVEHGRKVMDEAVALLQNVQVRPEYIPLIGPADEVLGLYLDQLPADLVVLGAFKDRGASGTATIGITAQRILQYAPMSVLICKGTETRIQRILTCLGRGNEQIIDWAAHFAQAIGAHLDLLHIVPTAASVAPHLLGTADQLLEPTKTQDATLAADLQRMTLRLMTHGQPPASLQVWQGEPIKAVLEATRKGAHDLLIVSSDEHAGSFVGSFADCVARFAPKSVLVMRSALLQENRAVSAISENLASA